MWDTAAAASPSPAATSSSHLCTAGKPKNDEKMPNRSTNSPRGKHATDSIPLTPLLNAILKVPSGDEDLAWLCPKPRVPPPRGADEPCAVWLDLDLHRNLSWKQHPLNQPYEKQHQRLKRCKKYVQCQAATGLCSSGPHGEGWRGQECSVTLLRRECRPRPR